MRVNKEVPDRKAGQKMRFVAHVVEGEDNNQPGRIRTLRFDKSGGDQVWLTTEWGGGLPGETKARLKAYSVSSDMQEKGAFLLADEYKRIGRPDLYDDYMEYENRKVPGQAWPDSLLPPRVLELQKIEKTRAVGTWKPPEKSLYGVPEASVSQSDATADSDDDDDDDDMPSIGGGYKPKVRKGSK